MDIVDSDIRQRGAELGVVERIIGASCGEDLALLLEGEVCPSVGGVDILLVQLEALVVRYGT